MEKKINCDAEMIIIIGDIVEYAELIKNQQIIDAKAKENFACCELGLGCKCSANIETLSSSDSQASIAACDKATHSIHSRIRDLKDEIKLLQDEHEKLTNKTQLKVKDDDDNTDEDDTGLQSYSYSLIDSLLDCMSDGACSISLMC